MFIVSIAQTFQPLMLSTEEVISSIILTPNISVYYFNHNPKNLCSGIERMGDNSALLFWKQLKISHWSIKTKLLFRLYRFKVNNTNLIMSKLLIHILNSVQTKSNYSRGFLIYWILNFIKVIINIRITSVVDINRLTLDVNPWVRVIYLHNWLYAAS